MIDLHCHVLPGIDDGPQTMEDTFRLARTAVESGIRTIVATPHVSWDWPDNDSTLIAAKVAEVNAALTEEGIDLTVLPGAEVALTRASELPDDELVALRLGGGPYLLVECPMSPATAGYEQVLLSLRARGHRIVLAHPERIPAFLMKPETLDRFIGDGMLGQVTAGSLTGQFGKDAQKFAFTMIERGWAHNVASDAHSSRRRPPSIGAQLTEAGLGAQADWFARAMPEAILSGAPLPPPPEMPKKRRGLGGLLRR